MGFECGHGGVTELIVERNPYTSSTFFRDVHHLTPLCILCFISVKEVQEKTKGLVHPQVKSIRGHVRVVFVEVDLVFPCCQHLINHTLQLKSMTPFVVWCV